MGLSFSHLKALLHESIEDMNLFIRELIDMDALLEKGYTYQPRVDAP